MNPFLKLMRAIAFLLLPCLLFFSCKKETEVLQAEVPSDYLPTLTGKYISYRLDSTLFTNFGAGSVVRSYQEKDQVDVQINDNLGRPAYRVFRFIRDTAGRNAWQPSGSYFVTAVNNTVEVVENNLRFLKLAGPVTAGRTWKGNQFLPDEPYMNLFDFGNDNFMNSWNYNYTETDATVNINGKPYTHVATVDQVNESINIPATVDALGTLNRSVEKYAKGLGLIYQELTMVEYQPTNTPRPGYRGFGVKRSIIDHN